MSTDEVAKSGLKRRRRAWLAGGFLAVAALITSLASWFCRPSINELVRTSQAALNRGATDEALRLAQLALVRAPHSTRALLTAAEIELALGRPESALTYFARVGNDGSASALVAATAAGDILLNSRRLSEAEAYYRRIAEFDPDNRTAHRRLARVLNLSGRREAASHYFALVRQGEFDTHELALLGNPQDAFDNPESIKIFDPSLDRDRQLAVGAAHYALHKHEISEAARQFRKLAMADPNDVDVQAGWGTALVETGTPDEFYHWHARLPREADAHPVIWASRARWAQKNDERDVAIRCYWEAIGRDPNDWSSNYHLALLLHATGDRQTAQAFQERSQRLKILLEALSNLHLQPDRLDLMLEAATQCESLGRLWEARGWYQAAASLRPELPKPKREADRLRNLVDAKTPQTLVAANPATRFDLSRFPLPNWPTNTRPRDSQAPRIATALRARVVFVDVATQAGIDFTYWNGDDPDVPGMPIRASTGGGVAILDFDGDGWPDVHLTQGCDWPPQPDQDRYLDRLFRNLGDLRFEDVTAAAGVGENSYSQGVTVGDYNADGFPDLYIANIGLNRLYRNNGDGTFGDATSGLPRGDSVWTTSCVLADLNGDSLPDLYDVTYLAGRDPLEGVCRDDRLKAGFRACFPGVYAAEQDRLLLNRGDGSFSDISQQAGILAPEGKGLGIVAADFRNAGRLDLFVANDTKPNFYFVNTTSSPGAPPTFVESALIWGCAYDAAGKAKASMGVAFDDADGDGLFDLFITAFLYESNTLLLQQPGDLFAERTGEAGLRDPSMQRLGFGTQFLDADLDGWPDLVVTNGHVDDFSEVGLPYRMPAQFFRNRGSGRFEELLPEELGVFFAREQLGRGLARVDFDRDGREDFVVSHLNTAAALVANCTSGAGHFFTLRLHGVECNRDAIGTVVRVAAGGRTRWRQLTAGDGYQASNQRQLVFGLGELTSIDQLIVHWPSGRKQQFSQVAADAEYVLVEGRTELIRRSAR